MNHTLQISKDCSQIDLENKNYIQIQSIWTAAKKNPNKITMKITVYIPFIIMSNLRIIYCTNIELRIPFCVVSIKTKFFM